MKSEPRLGEDGVGGEAGRGGRSSGSGGDGARGARVRGTKAMLRAGEWSLSSARGSLIRRWESAESSTEEAVALDETEECVHTPVARLTNTDPAYSVLLSVLSPSLALALALALARRTDYGFVLALVLALAV
jgi:hypothetical protein